MRNERVAELVRKYTDTMLAYRKEMHMHPELSHEEKETAAYIAARLKEMGLEPKTGVGGYGVTAVIEGTAPAPAGAAAESAVGAASGPVSAELAAAAANKPKCVGLRADIDALPIMEETGLSFASQNPGVMHACGHDTHAAMLLGAAHVLLDMRDAFCGKVKLVFQPAEEDAADCGAKKMIADGALEDPHVDAMFAQHVAPDFPTGTIICGPSAMSASSDRIYITVRGKKSHGSRPEDGVDAIVIAAQIISTMQSIVARVVGPHDCTVLTIGTIKGGSRYNVIADEVVMEGTCRNLNPAVRDKVEEKLRHIVTGVAESMGGYAEFKYLRCYSPTLNDPAKFEIVKEVTADVIGPDALYVPKQANLGGEDFSFFAEKVPSAYYQLGTTAPGKPYYPVHHGKMVPDEKALSIGMEVMVNCALKFLNS